MFNMCIQHERDMTLGVHGDHAERTANVASHLWPFNVPPKQLILITCLTCSCERCYSQAWSIIQKVSRQHLLILASFQTTEEQPALSCEININGSNANALKWFSKETVDMYIRHWLKYVCVCFLSVWGPWFDWSCALNIMLNAWCVLSAVPCALNQSDLCQRTEMDDSDVKRFCECQTLTWNLLKTNVKKVLWPTNGNCKRFHQCDPRFFSFSCFAFQKNPFQPSINFSYIVSLHLKRIKHLTPDTLSSQLCRFLNLTRLK